MDRTTSHQLPKGMAGLRLAQKKDLCVNSGLCRYCCLVVTKVTIPAPHPSPGHKEKYVCVHALYLLTTHLKVALISHNHTSQTNKKCRKEVTACLWMETCTIGHERESAVTCGLP